MPKKSEPTRKKNPTPTNSSLAVGNPKAKPLPASVPEQIHRLFEKQQSLYTQEALSPSALEELAYTNLEWEQCWELWCQDQARLYAEGPSVPPRVRPAKVAMKTSKAATAPRSTEGTSPS